MRRPQRTTSQSPLFARLYVVLRLMPSHRLTSASVIICGNFSKGLVRFTSMIIIMIIFID